jgi:hypothetical protein
VREDISMVARRRGTPEPDEPASTLPPALANLEESDEDPALFWGPNWKKELDEAIKEVAEGRGDIFYSEEEFLQALEADMNSPSR